MMTEMIYLAAILLLLPLFLGMLTVKLFHQKEFCNAMLFITGVILLFSVFEVLAIVAVKYDFTLNRLTTIFIGVCAILLLITVFICRKELNLIMGRIRKSISFEADHLILAMLVILIFTDICIYSPFDSNDTVLETVGTTLFSDSLYQYNPLTGAKMVNGMFPVNQIASLNLFLASLSKTANASAIDVVEYVFPGFVMILHLLVVWLWAKKTDKPCIYMIVYAGLLLCSANIQGTFTFRLLHNGYLGNTFLTAVLIPFAVYLLCTRKKVSGIVTKLFLTCLIITTAVMAMNLSTIKEDLMGKPLSYYGITLGVVLLTAAYLIILNRIQIEKKVLFHWLLKCIIPCALSVVTGWWLPYAAYILADILERQEAGMKRKTAITGIVVIALLCGSIYLFTPGDAEYRTDDVKTADRVLQAVTEEKSDQIIMLAAPREIMDIARKNDASIMLPYGRDYWTPGINREVGDLYDDMAYSLYSKLVMMEDGTATEEVMSAIAQESYDLNCNYLVTTQPITNRQWSFVKEIDGYSVYVVIK